MVKRVPLDQVPPKRGKSPVNIKVHAEFLKLKMDLENKLSPFEAAMVTLDELPTGKPNRKNAGLKLLQMAKQYVKAKKMPYHVFSRTEGGQMTVYVAAN